MRAARWAPWDPPDVPAWLVERVGQVLADLAAPRPWSEVRELVIASLSEDEAVDVVLRLLAARQ